MKRVLPALIFVLHAHGVVQAQAPVQEPAALTATRTAFMRQVMADSQMLTQQYERALAKVEAEVAAAGDYEEARAIRLRREQLQALYAGTASSLATPLPLALARMMGSAQASGETLSGWRSNGSGAEWLNFRLMPGSYYLEFEVNMSDAPVAGSIYASSKFQPQQSASFEFDEVTLLGIATENHRTFDIKRSTDEITFTTVRVGPLTFSRNPVTLRFATADGYPANIIRIRNLRLVPVTDDAAVKVDLATSPPSNSTTAMQRLSAALKDAIDTARKAAAARHLDELNDLAVTKPELKEQVEAEIRRMQGLGDQKIGRTGMHAIASTGGGLSGFEDMTDARLAEEEPLSGERFKVVHEGRTMMVRLLWVDCAPVDEDDESGLRRFAKHFNIEDEDVIAIGRTAREFTASYLRDKPLRLLIRPDRDKDGTMAALLFLPNVGLYQNVLINHGLAAVVAPAREKQHSAMERAFLATLSALETSARNRRPAPGAWALSAEANGGKAP